MFGCRLKTKIPIHNKLLNAEIFNNVDERFAARQERQKHYYDRGARDLKPLNIGDNVTAYDFNLKTWEPVKIVSKNNRSYVIKNRLVTL